MKSRCNVVYVRQSSICRGVRGVGPPCFFLTPLLLASGRPPGVGLTPSNLLAVIPYTKRLNHNLDIGLYCRRVNNLYLADYISTHVFLRDSAILSYYKRT